MIFYHDDLHETKQGAAKDVKKRLLTNIVLLLASLLAVFIVLEAVARFTLERPETVIIDELDTKAEYASRAITTRGMPDRSLYISTNTGIRLKRSAYVLVKDHNLSHRDIEITTNSLGYRYDELDEKTDNDFRILVLGDSVTFGDYLPAQETYPARIEQYLRANPPEKLRGKNIQVINAAIGGIDLQNELAILLETGLSIEPDIVLVGHYLNDANVSLYLNITRLPPLLKKSYLLSFLAGRLDTLRAAYKYEQAGKKVSFEKEREAFFLSKKVSNSDWRTDEGGFNKLILEAMKDWGYAWTDNAWKKTAHLMELMREVSEDNDFTLAFIMLPVSYQVHADALRDAPQEKFNKLSSEFSIKHLDLLPGLREKFKRDRANVFYDHCHQNDEGNAFIGKEVGRWLVEDVI